MDLYGSTFKRVWLAAGLVFAVAAGASAQSFSTVYFSAGYNSVDLTPLTDLLDRSQPFNYGTLPEHYYSFGVGMRIGSTKWRVGWDLHYLGRDGTPPGVSNGSPVVAESRLSDTQFLIDVNYGLVRANNNRLVMAPTVGVGLETTSLSFRLPGADGDARDFDGVLADPGRGVQLTRHNLLLDAALQIDFALSFDPEFDEVGWILGLRAGYHFMPIGLKWQEHIGDLGGRGVDDGPKFGLAGPYLRLTLGL